MTGNFLNEGLTSFPGLKFEKHLRCQFFGVIGSNQTQLLLQDSKQQITHFSQAILASKL